jgi:hypothetical protein
MVDRNSTNSVVPHARTNLGKKHLRQAILIARALAGFACIAGGEEAADGATQTAQVTANAAKPLTLAKLQDLDLGTATIGPGTWSNAAVSISQAGTFSCPNSNIVCTGATMVAKYNVQGSNGQTVRISAPNVTMINQNDSTQTLTLVTDAPASVLLTNSGKPGLDFAVGGSITLNSNTAAGTYVGTFNVTVDY